MATLGSPQRTALLVILALTFVACATVQHGPVQRIPVDSEPAGAVVYTEDCGPGSTKEATTPGVIWVSRRAERCALIFTAPGYELERGVLKRAIAEEFLDNLDFLEADSFFIGGFLAGAGFGVDALTGALFEQQPNDVFVSLVPFEELRLEIDEESDEESEEPEEPPREEPCPANRLGASARAPLSIPSSNCDHGSGSSSRR